MIDIGLVTLSLDSGSKLAVAQWVAWWSGLPGESSSKRKLAIFRGLGNLLGGVYRLWNGWGRGWDFSSYGMRATKGWDCFHRGSWPLKTPFKKFNLAIGGGLGWMKWLKNGTGESILSGENFIGYVKVPLYSVCLNLNVKKQNSNQDVKIEKIVVLVKTFDH